ncbi:hypothetical protein TNCV_4984281 [Trichonephila clavipes]|nr:hypothetical protein TNCV_4984281 [Trichonephila clavipes]
MEGERKEVDFHAYPTTIQSRFKWNVVTVKESNWSKRERRSPFIILFRGINGVSAALVIPRLFLLTVARTRLWKGYPGDAFSSVFE